MYVCQAKLRRIAGKQSRFVHKMNDRAGYQVPVIGQLDWIDGLAHKHRLRVVKRTGIEVEIYFNRYRNQ